MPGPYDTPIPPGMRSAYEAWLRRESAKQRRDVSRDIEDYDVQGFFLGKETTDERGHGSDRYKKPNHPTFSTESQYHGQGGNTGGRWEQRDGRTAFVPSATNLSHWPFSELQRYFRQVEPDVMLADPDGVPVIPRTTAAPPLPQPPLPPGLKPEPDWLTWMQLINRNAR